MLETNPNYYLSSFMGFRAAEERAAYENVSDFSKNWFDRAAYPQFQKYEKNILKFTKELHNNYFGWGFLTVDSSEAIYCALLIHLLRFKKRSSSTQPNFVVTKFRHICFKKAAILLGVEMREVNALEDGGIDLKDLKSKIDNGTFCAIGVAGNTGLGSYDNIVGMDELCQS